jgi:hypothetical protein
VADPMRYSFKVRPTELLVRARARVQRLARPERTKALGPM